MVGHLPVKLFSKNLKAISISFPVTLSHIPFSAGSLLSRLPGSDTSVFSLDAISFFFVTEDDKIKFNKLISKAKELSRQGELERALCLCEKAYKIRQSEKLKRKIEKLQVTTVVSEQYSCCMFPVYLYVHNLGKS